MGLPPWEVSSSQLYVMITGANSGLGFSIAERLIDEFLSSASTPKTKHLVLILCTRSRLKTSATISKLRVHLKKFAQHSAHAECESGKAQARGDVYNWKDALRRIHFLGVEADLCDLTSVYAVADRLKNGTVRCPGAPSRDAAEESFDMRVTGIRIPRLDVIMLNAALGAWVGISWTRAIWMMMSDTIVATTWPTFRIAAQGLVTESQLRKKGMEMDVDAVPLLEKGEQDQEPPLGKIFCSNVFGHYILCHELMALLSTASTSQAEQGGRIIWVSTIDVSKTEFCIEDIQGLRAPDAYGGSKRLIDLLALTSTTPATKKHLQTFCDPGPRKTTAWEGHQEQYVQPQLYLTHPGIFQSEIVPLNFILAGAWTLLLYFVRLLGSPWHTASGYKAATAPVWLALTDTKTLEDMGGNRVKWGSSVNRWGNERVKMTEVEGWGWNGVVDGKGNLVGERDRDGRRRGATECTIEEREEFEVLGAKCWVAMEELRREWEGRLGVKRVAEYS